MKLLARVKLLFHAVNVPLMSRGDITHPDTITYVMLMDEVHKRQTKKNPARGWVLVHASCIRGS